MNSTERKFAVGIGAALLISLASAATLFVPSLRVLVNRASVNTTITLVTNSGDGFCHPVQPERFPLSHDNRDTVTFQTFEDRTFTLTFPRACPFTKGCPVVIRPYSATEPLYTIPVAVQLTFMYTINNGADCTPLNGVGIKIQK